MGMERGMGMVGGNGAGRRFDWGSGHRGLGGLVGWGLGCSCFIFDRSGH